MSAKTLKLILLLAFWVMVGFALSHWLGFWGVFFEIMALLFLNIVTFEEQVKKAKGGAK